MKEQNDENEEIDTIFKTMKNHIKELNNYVEKCTNGPQVLNYLDGFQFTEKRLM